MVPKDSGTILLSRPFVRLRGRCWTAQLPEHLYTGDEAEDGSGRGFSTIVLYENGVPLGPPHSTHEIIAERGGGAFSHWKGKLYFSTSDGSHANFNGRRYSVTTDLDSYLASYCVEGRPGFFPIVPDAMRPWKGRCYVVTLDRRLLMAAGIEGDTPNAPCRSTLCVFEDGRALFPPHAPHEHIARSGLGAYSHWKDSLWFSSGDGTDPRQNGREYTFTIDERTYLASFCARPGPVGNGRNHGWERAGGAGEEEGAGEGSSEGAVGLPVAPFPDDPSPVNAIMLPGPFVHDGGACWTCRLPSLPAERLGLRLDGSSTDAFDLFENDRLIGPGCDDHDEIRAAGGGRYSIWCGCVLFSSVDGSDPNANGRRYVLARKRRTCAQARREG